MITTVISANDLSKMPAVYYGIVDNIFMIKDNGEVAVIKSVYAERGTLPYPFSIKHLIKMMFTEMEISTNKSQEEIERDMDDSNSFMQSNGCDTTENSADRSDSEVG